MKELFDVKFAQDGSFDMQLSNGYINVPSENGCYVLSTGCGTGKTESCKSIIRQKAKEGILYCVDTIKELDKMYQWIISESKSIGITPADVIIISSESRHSGFLNLYRNSPEILMEKKIVLITHVRFWTDLINYFLIYQPKSQVTPFDGDFQTLLARNDLRKFIIFDETPKFIKPFFHMQREILSFFSNLDNNGCWHCKSLSEMNATYHKFLKNSSLNPFPPETSRINRIKREVAMGLIPKFYGQWINSTEDQVNITFTPLNLAQKTVNTKILILEGVGNVLFQGSPYYKLLDIKQKYQCRVQFNQFSFGIKRRVDLNEPAYDEFIEWTKAKIIQNQQANRKTLVTVWKNQGKNSAKSEDSGYYNKVKADLSIDTRLNDSMYRVIYYGGAESKSTNEFRDYAEIILAGEWNLMNTETAKFNNHFGVNIDNDSHRLWAFVQLLCRIGIRLHDGKDYTVSYSSDFNSGFIARLEDYMKNDVVPVKEVKDDKIPQWLTDKFDRVKMRANFRDEIMKLGEFNDSILECIRREEGYQFSIRLNELYEIIPRDRKKRERYNNLKSALKKMHITMSIR